MNMDKILTRKDFNAWLRKKVTFICMKTLSVHLADKVSHKDAILKESWRI